MSIFREIREHENGVFTKTVDIKSEPLFFNNEDKGLAMFQFGGGYIFRDKNGDMVSGEIHYTDIISTIKKMENGTFNKEFLKDFIRMKEECEKDEQNKKRYNSDNFNIYIF